MFYIEKNDKPNIWERIFNLIKIEDNKIMLPISENVSEKKREKMASKINKKVLKNSNSKKIVLSKELIKSEVLINYLNTYGLEIQDGKWLFKVLIPEVIEYIVEKKSIEVSKSSISILINDLTDVEYENIKILSQKYKNINIVTNHIEKFKRLEEELNEEGILIIVANNKKKSLIKSQIIINVDFPNELINRYNIKDDAIIVNLRGNIKINAKRFNGININNYEIDYRDDKKENIVLSNKYYLKDVYESEIYKKQRFQDIREKIKDDKVIIRKLFTNNGEL